jgi:tRNA(Ile)-lysidine synthase
VSGGPDSVAMLFSLKEIKNEMGFDLLVFHINHMLRGEESEEEELFVKNLSESLSLPFYSAKVDVLKYRKNHKVSIQVAARELRYCHFKRFADLHSVAKIALGHTANDQAETVLMRILKGSGLKGISGIPPTRENKFIRPMMEIHREEINEFLDKNNIHYLVDSSNLKNHYLRNRIKNKLIPSLKKEYNPSIVETLCRSSKIFRQEDYFISEMTQCEFHKLIIKRNSEQIILDARRFQTLHIALTRRIILEAIYQFPNSGRHAALKIVDNILEVIQSNFSGKTISITKGLIFKYRYNQLIFQSLKKNVVPPSIKQKKLSVPGKTKITEIEKEATSKIINKKEIPKNFKKMSPFTAFLDFDYSGKDLFLRSRQRGDRFSPLGIKANKKLKDYFIDKKIPREERDSIPIITNHNSILWIVGHQISEWARVKEDTTDVLMVEVGRAKS